MTTPGSAPGPGSDERHPRRNPSGERAARRDPGRRRLTLVCLALVGAAAALWGAARTVPALQGVALLALAAVAAFVALAGVARRVVAGLVALAGVAAAALAAGTPLLAGLGALLMVGAAVAVLIGEPRLPRWGARPAAEPAPADPDRAAWDALDAGRDPTADGGAPGRAV